MNNPAYLNLLKFFDADPGWKKFGSGIQDKHPGFATLLSKIISVYICPSRKEKERISKEDLKPSLSVPVLS